MDSMQLDPETVDNLDAYNHIPPQLMEKCAALSVRPDTVKNLVQSMQGEQSTQQTCGVACRLSAVASPLRMLLRPWPRHHHPCFCGSLPVFVEFSKCWERRSSLSGHFSVLGAEGRVVPGLPSSMSTLTTPQCCQGCSRTWRPP